MEVGGKFFLQIQICLSGWNLGREFGIWAFSAIFHLWRTFEVFFKGGNFVRWLKTKCTNSFLCSILLLFIFQCFFAFRKSLVGWWQSRGKQTRAWYPSRSFTCASREKFCQGGLSLHIVSNMNISAGHQSKSRQQFIGIPFQRDPTDEQAQPTLHKYFSVLPLYISTSRSTFELILIQIHTQNFWSRFHDELLFVRFFLDHLCVPPWPPILTWSRVSRSTCETSLRSLLLPGWSYHTSVFHLLSSLAMIAATTRSSEKN